MSDAVSGTVPEEPVVNRNNGQLFERRLVEKHVKVRLQCSVTWIMNMWHRSHFMQTVDSIHNS